MSDLVWLIVSQVDVWLPAACLIIALSLTFPGGLELRSTAVTPIALSVAATLLPLLGAWLVGRTHPNAIAGLLPWNDAAGYYGCAVSILEGDSMSPFCQRRPIYTLYLAGLIKVVGGSLLLALILQTLINGAAVLVAALYSAQRWGVAAGVVAIALLGQYVGSFSTATLTENGGFVFGTAGLVLVLVGAERREMISICIGMFLLSVALNARAGAFFVLPALALWPFVAEHFTFRARVRTSALMLGAAVLGFAPGSLANWFFGGDTSEVHSNFSYTLFGIAAGGERWIYALERLPGASSDEIFAAAFELIRTQPLLFLEGLFQGFLEYIQRILTYVPWLPARVVLAFLWLWGVATLAIRRADETSRVLFLSMTGIVLSAPFLSIDGDTRVYAATIVIDGLLAALGAFRLFGARASSREILMPIAVLLMLTAAAAFMPTDLRAWGVAIVAGGTLSLVAKRFIDVADSFGSAGSRFWYAPAALGALTLTLATTALWAASRTPAGVDVADAVIACEPWSPIVARPGRESPALRIDVENGIGPTTVTPQNFRAGLHPLVHARDQLDRLGEGDVLVSAYDLLDARAVGRRMHLLLGEVGSVPVDGRRHLFCVTAQDGGIGMRRIMDVWPID